MSDSENKVEESASSGRKWWPHVVLTLVAIMLVVTCFIAVMADMFPVPDDAPDEIPFPDDGADIPGPEWLFMLFWLPFWYFKGRLKRYLFLTTLIPFAGLLYFILLPYMHKIPLHKIPVLGGMMKKAKGLKRGFKKSLIYGLPAVTFGIVLAFGFWFSGHQAKVLGCDSCHSPAMGPRMAIPPADVAKYYIVDRAMQIGIGKYRAGKTISDGQSLDTVYEGGDDEGGYKDANWQMRHMYEPTFTW